MPSTWGNAGVKKRGHRNTWRESSNQKCSPVSWFLKIWSTFSHKNNLFSGDRIFRTVCNILFTYRLKMTQKRHHHLWLFLWENVLQTSHDFKITCSNNIFVYENIYVTHMYKHTCILLKVIILGGKMGKINYWAILGLITFISNSYISVMTEFL